MENNELEKFGTTHSWSQELGISYRDLCKRAEALSGIDGKTSCGRVRIYYSESAIRQACADILLPVLEADSDGFFMRQVGDQKTIYGTAFAWSKKFLGVNRTTIARRLDDIKGITGKDNSGHWLRESFYPEPDVYEACKDLLQTQQQAEASGFFTIGEERHATVKLWSQTLSISFRSIIKRLKGKIGILGKTHQGNIRMFYGEQSIREACSDLLYYDIPETDETGFLTLIGEGKQERYGPIRCWARELRIPPSTISLRLKKKAGITGRYSGNRVLVNGFYAETVVRAVCKDLLSNKLGDGE